MTLKTTLGKALILLLVYELAMTVLGLDGLSLGKLLITCFVWISFGLTFRTFIYDFEVLRKKIPFFTFIVLVLLLSWNLVTILRTLLFDGDAIRTIFGNTHTSLALLVPFAIIYGTKLRTILILNQYYKLLLKVGIVLFLVFFILSFGGGLNVKQTLTLLLLLQPVVFLLTVLHYFEKTKKILIIVSGIILFYMAYLYSVRTMAIRELLLCLCFVGVYLYHRFKWKWILYVSFSVITIPFILLQQSMVTGESAITKYLSSSDDDLAIDTRTFVYMELYEDLIENNKLWVGKGANGRYYSDYFSRVEGDSPMRLNIEVAVLGLLLKGGLIAVVLNLTLIITAIVLAFFKSNNSFIIGMGYILLVHVVLMFLENVISYSSYNFLTWILVGMCLSKSFRNASNAQIQKLIKI